MAATKDLHPGYKKTLYSAVVGFRSDRVSGNFHSEELTEIQEALLDGHALTKEQLGLVHRALAYAFKKNTNPDVAVMIKSLREMDLTS